MKTGLKNTNSRLLSKTRRTDPRLRDLRFFCFALLLVLLPAARVRDAALKSRFDVAVSSSAIASAPQRLTPLAEAELLAIVDAAKLDDLHWPVFSKYRSEVRELYDSFHGALPWIRDSRPSSQALLT
jgi:hypothetical protein